jgi:hypothetical protein
MHGSPFVAADYAEQISHGSPSSTSVWMALTLHGSGNTEPCVDQRPNPLRRTPRRSIIDRETVPTATVDRPFARGAQGRDDIRTECAGIIAGSWFADTARRGEELIAAGVLMLAGHVDLDELGHWVRVGWERRRGASNPYPDGEG